VMGFRIGTVIYLVTDKYELQNIGWVVELVAPPSPASGFPSSPTGPYFWAIAITDPEGLYPARRGIVPWIMPPPKGDERVRYAEHNFKDFNKAVAAVRDMNAELMSNDLPKKLEAVRTKGGNQG
jgi:hypothetical protein